jgi:8-amino-3,8-dideoxy-alpha-D-manno-octulosonate transaminase
MPGTELFGAEERKEIEDVLSTGIMFRYNHDPLRNNIWKAKDFEAEAKKITQAKYALAVSNGSAAIMAALAASGIGTGDEVICPPFTYIATIEAILFLGGLPVFAEVDETLCLSAEGIKNAITPKTKAVCLVHMCGGNANMDEIMAVVKQHHLILVEDAGQAFASSYKGTYTGMFGTAGAYSFDFFKIATAGEGGILVTNDENTYKLADSFCDHGHDHIGDKRGMENHPIIGFNFRISELHAAVGAAQTRKVTKIRDINRSHKKFLQAKLSKTEGIGFAKLGDESGDSATFLNILMPNTEIAQRTVDEFNKAGIAGFDYWFKNMYHFINQWDHIKELKTASKLPIHVLGAPQDYKNLHLPKTQEVIGRLISFGIKCSWTEEYMTEMTSKISACVKKAMEPVNA